MSCVKIPNFLKREKDASERPQRRRKLLGLSTSALYQVTSIPGSQSASGPLSLRTPANAQACELLELAPSCHPRALIDKQAWLGGLSNPLSALGPYRGVIDKPPQTIGWPPPRKLKTTRSLRQSIIRPHHRLSTGCQDVARIDYIHRCTVPYPGVSPLRFLVLRLIRRQMAE